MKNRERLEDFQHSLLPALNFDYFSLHTFIYYFITSIIFIFIFQYLSDIAFFRCFATFCVFFQLFICCFSGFYFYVHWAQIFGCDLFSYSYGFIVVFSTFDGFYVTISHSVFIIRCSINNFVVCGVEYVLNHALLTILLPTEPWLAIRSSPPHSQAPCNGILLY